ncbi:MAG: lipopolysaccharide biosynthesis protein [Candidatus Magasanikbacteria bacterium]
MLQKLKKGIKYFLHKLEKFFKTDMIYIFKNISWLSGKSIVSSTAAFILAIAFANLIPKETYGTYQYVKSIIGFLAIFSLPGLGNSITRSVAKGFEGIYDSAFKVKLKWGVLTLLGGILISGYYFFQDNLTLSLALLIPAFLMPIKQAFDIYESFLSGKKKFSLLTKSSIFEQFIAATTVVSVLLYTDSLILIILSYYGIWTILAIFFFFYFKKNIDKNKKKEKGVMSYGKHLSLMRFITSLSNTMEKVILWHFVGPVALATYSFGVKPVKEIRTFLFKNLTSVAFPKLSEKKMETLQKTLPGKILKSLLIIVPIVLLYILLAPYLYKMFFPKYMDAILISQVFVLTLLFGPKNFLHDALTAQKKIKSKYIIDITSSITKIISLLILIPTFQIWGLIGSIFITNIVATIIISIFFLKIRIN